MLESIHPYELKYIQKEKPKSRDAFDFCLVYSFFTKSDPERIKYIVRAEFQEDVIAIKFYAAKNSKSENKYHLILDKNRYRGTLCILMTCVNLIPMLLKDYPSSSFIIKASNTIDIKSKKEEDDSVNQRFRIYRWLFSETIGDQTFEHIEYKDVSVYLLVNKSNKDIDSKKKNIEKLFLTRYVVSEKSEIPS